LIALLRAVSYGWRQEALAGNAREISALGRSLHERLGTLTGHFAKLGKSLEAAVGHYNAAVGSYETRVLGSARKFEDLQAAAEGSTLPHLEPVAQAPRLPAAADLLEPADDFGFASGPRDKALSAASDLRSALDA
jgi:DNA recombination protein RmuC